MKNLLFLFIFTFSLSAVAKEKICARIFLHDKVDLELTPTEKHMICGDKKLDAYKVIPPYEAAYFLTSFLQTRGYLKPRFETIDDTLHVHLGKQSKLNDVTVVTDLREKKALRKDLLLHDKHRVLTPTLLTKVEDDSRHFLRRRGYPCVTAKSMADADNGKVSMTLDRTYLHPFGIVDREEIPGLRPEALEKFSPFKAEDLFDEREIKLEEKRLIRAEVVQTAYFLEDCSEEGRKFSLAEKFYPGPPRTFRYGIGASTEMGPMISVRWSNNRMGSMASNLSFKAVASFRQQSLTAIADSYIWDKHPRRSILSQVDVTRSSQYDYEQLLVKASPFKMKWTRDDTDHLYTWIFGPSLESTTFHSNEDSNTKSTNTGVIEGSFDWLHHDYEFYDSHPQEGDRFNFNFGYRSRAFGFSDESLRLDTSYVVLKDITELKNGKIIGAAHFMAGTLMINDSATLNGLPPNVKFFGGGSDDIRGFLLNTLPKNEGLGAKTKLAMKLETRKTSFFYSSLEGFAFVDGGFFGNRSYKVESELFYSPGIGLRWSSPIGMVQTYWARALTLNRARDFGDFLYLGLGGTF